MFADEVKDDIEALESFVDRLGVSTVLEFLAEVCGEKEEHVRSNWGDEALARRWGRHAKALFGAMARAEKIDSR